MNNALVVTLFVITWSGMALFGYLYVINKPKYGLPTYPKTSVPYVEDDVIPQRRVKTKDRMQKFVEEGANGPVIRNQVVFPKDGLQKKPNHVQEKKAREKSEKIPEKTMIKTDKNTLKSEQKLHQISKPLIKALLQAKKELSSPKRELDEAAKSGNPEKAPEHQTEPSNPSAEEDSDSALRRCKKDKMSILQTKVTRHNRDEIEEYIRSQCTNQKTFGRCEHTALVGPLAVRLEKLSFKTLHEDELHFVKMGGWYVPHDCLETQSVAIVIPFRNRYEHLPVLLRQLVPILYRQRLHHRIFVVEQDDQSDFNRGKLMNVGYAEALKQFPYTCFVFHDVDLLPENDKINYGCKHSPTHLSVAIDKFNYRLPYSSIFGGIEMFKTEDYKTVNGFSNIFYSWGGEDDVLSSRLNLHGMKIHRQSVQTARYTMIRHTAKDKQRTPELIAQTDLLMRTARNHPQDDGLSSLQYKVNDIIDHQLYTLIKVDLQKEKEETFGISLR